MKKRDFLVGMCCGFFVARFVISRVGEFNLSNASQIITVAVVVFALSSLWEWIKNGTTKNTSRRIALRRLPKYS